jgi:catechol 2,3-dioxygenase-like lactoylglutathione lyase family enzyme
MLANHDSSAIVAVKDLDRARAFYEGVLGLKATAGGIDQDVLSFDTGATKLIAYRSDEAGTNRANAVVWGVGEDIDAIVAALEAKQVTFEHYPHIGRLDGNVHRVGDYKLVWLKDPDGNILHLNNM